MSDTQLTATYATPFCVVCRQVSYIELPAHIAAALSTGVPVQDLLPSRPGRSESSWLAARTPPAEPPDSERTRRTEQRSRRSWVGRRGGGPPRAPPCGNRSARLRTAQAATRS